MVRGARTLAIPLTMLPFSTTPEDFDRGHCLACDLLLELHQPDTGFPERLIGICGACGCWYLIDTVADTDDAVMVMLPEGESIRNALSGHPP